MTERTKTVLVVGAGPTGLTAAMELSRLGVSVRIVDKLAEASPTSRALAVQSRTMELFERRGLSERMLECGNVAKAVTLYGRGKPLGTQTFARIPSRFNFILMLSQAETERLLTEQLRRLGVEIERSVEMIAFSQGRGDRAGGAVRAVLQSKDGSLEEVDAAYLIAAEGAHSSVRRTMQLAFDGETLTETFLLGDLYLEGLLPDDEISLFLAEDGFMALFPIGKRRFRMIASDPSKAARTGEPTLDELQAAYNRNSPVAARLHDLLWSSYFVINSRMLAELRQGLVFFGGDSAHIHSPAGGQGMNTGIQDMVDLSWKMAMVLKGEASPELLDTYGSDRLPVIRDVLKRTETMMLGISTEHPMLHDVLTHAIPVALGLDIVQEKMTGFVSETLIGYRKSSLSTDDGVSGSLKAGDRIPELLVRVAGFAGDRRLQEEIEVVGLTLLVIEGRHTEVASATLEDALAPWQQVLCVRRIAAAASDRDGENFAAMFGHRGALLLVRPDSYVGFSGGSDSVERLRQWMERWFAAPGGVVAHA